MASAYRVPDNKCACVEPGTTRSATVTVGRFNTDRASPAWRRATVPSGRHTRSRGGDRRRQGHLGGGGLDRRRQDLAPPRLGKNHGRYWFHEWTAPFRPDRKGDYQLQVRATNRGGETQPATATWNPAGYMRNVIETVRVTAA